MYQQIGGYIGDLITFGIFLYFTLVLFGVTKWLYEVQCGELSEPKAWLIL